MKKKNKKRKKYAEMQQREKMMIQRNKGQEMVLHRNFDLDLNIE